MKQLAKTATTYNNPTHQCKNKKSTVWNKRQQPTVTWNISHPKILRLIVWQNNHSCSELAKSDKYGLYALSDFYMKQMCRTTNRDDMDIIFFTIIRQMESKK